MSRVVDSLSRVLGSLSRVVAVAVVFYMIVCQVAVVVVCVAGVVGISLSIAYQVAVAWPLRYVGPLLLFAQ